MLVGHFAVGLVAKRIEPKMSLGTLVLAALLADFLWATFLITGIEHVEFKPGRGAANYVAGGDIGWSHSLLMDFVWAALLAAVYFSRRRYRRGALVVFAAAVSHWLLDFVSLAVPLAPDVSRYFGLGLWYSVPATIIVEGGLWLFALVLYSRATSPKNRLGRYAFWIVAVLLTLAWYNNITGPPPPSPRVAGVTSLIFFSLVVAWAYWINRLRPAKTQLNNHRQESA
ncbi:MAG TPA: metal-dependent hydrolase [Blastocatellia bacterium]|nr:metal-dependent hydrolase [Blastocatellia bacterium]